MLIDASIPGRLEPVGICIYCFDSRRGAGENLTDEHVVPEGLGGKLVLPQASCRRCSTDTSKFERFISQQMLDILRTQLGVVTKKKKRIARPKPVIFARYGHVWKKVWVEPTDYPFQVSVPVFYGPAILLPQAEPNTKINTAHSHSMFKFSELDGLRSSLGADRIEVPSGKTNILIFARLLAKIAHTYAAGTYGLGNFEPSLLSYNRQDDRDFPSHHLIGGESERKPPSMRRHEIAPEVVQANGRLFIVVTIRLFADQGFPTYRVVTGFPKSEPNRRLYQRMTGLKDRNRIGFGPNVPSVMGVGDWDYMCAFCNNIIVRGGRAKFPIPVDCSYCGASCVPLTEDHPFGMPRKNIGKTDTGYQLDEDRGREAELMKTRTEMYWINGDFITHLVSAVDPNDKNFYRYS